MNLNKVVFRFVSISFSILVILLVLIGFVKIGTYCYDFGYRVFTEAPVDAERAGMLSSRSQTTCQTWTSQRN